MRLGWNIKIGLSGMVHQKLLHVTTSALQQASSGKVVNLVSTDVLRFDQFFTSLHFGWMAAIDLIVIATLICYKATIEAGLAGVGVMMVAIFINVKFSKVR